MPGRAAARHRAGARAALPRQRDDRGAGLRRGLASRARAGARLHRGARGAAGARCRCTWRRPPRAACSSCAARRCAPGSSRPITAGKFRMFGGGSTVVYAQGADADGTLTRVFVERDRGGHAGDRAGAARHPCLLRGRRPAGHHAVRRRALRRHSRRAPLPHRAFRREHHPGAPAGAVRRRGGARRRAHARAAAVSQDPKQRGRAPLAHRVSRSWRWCWPSSRCRWRACGRARAAMRASVTPC